MNTPANILAQVRRDMARHVAALARPSGVVVRVERRAYVAELARQVARLEATLEIAKARKEGSV